MAKLASCALVVNLWPDRAAPRLGSALNETRIIAQDSSAHICVDRSLVAQDEQL